MKKRSELAIEFLKKELSKELSSLEKSYIQFKQIYEYFQSEGEKYGNVDVKKLLTLDESKSKYIFIRL